ARLHTAGTILAGVCTGAMLLAAAHLVIGRHATTHHLALDELRAAGATVVDARVVDDGDLITSGGVTSGTDLALWLVERFFGPQVALQIESRLEYERRGTVWRRHTAS